MAKDKAMAEECDKFLLSVMPMHFKKAIDRCKALGDSNAKILTAVKTLGVGGFVAQIQVDAYLNQHNKTVWP